MINDLRSISHFLDFLGCDPSWMFVVWHECSWSGYEYSCPDWLLYLKMIFSSTLWSVHDTTIIIDGMNTNVHDLHVHVQIICGNRNNIHWSDHVLGKQSYGSNILSIRGYEDTSSLYHNIMAWSIWLGSAHLSGITVCVCTTSEHIAAAMEASHILIINKSSHYSWHLFLIY